MSVIVPDLVGTDLLDTDDLLGAIGLLSRYTGEFSATLPLGQIMSQDPVAGASAEIGDVVNAVISKGIEQVATPDVVGETQAAAIAAIEGAGLVAVVKTAYSETVVAGYVISQVPVAGWATMAGNIVHIVVSLGARTTPPIGDKSLVTDIADAVVEELNAATAGTFSVPFTAARRVLPEFEPSELKTLAVTVVPKSVEIATQTRSMCLRDVSVDIGIQKKLNKEPGLDADVASIGVLADEITNYLRQRTLSQATYATWVKIDNSTVYSPEHLAEQRVYTSVLTVMYRMMT
jgi:hypothetical protein